MKHSVKMQVLILLVIASCFTSCIILTKSYFTCILGINSFLITNTAKTIATDSVAINVRGVEKQTLSDEDYVVNIYQRYR